MSGSKALAELKRELGGQVPGELAQLPAADQKRLLEAVRAAKQRQNGTLREAIDKGLGFVPAILRVALRRILFP